ncbi:hypothetical protein JAAARDRAFT_572121 [Jaapia argillacea MUCL 33604]|uniref:Uncharacterized protein n=1 Tax=Jaapia argillacea MUCL 33604 TaxID=933084 RepID=A0A067QEP4_9AGAM|nr:hypothetical protein JAAARDRAFT_572121 [Jaapia argillacea MUCL 33604]
MPAVRNLKPANSRRQPPQLIKKPRGQSHRLMDVLGLSKHEWKVLARRIQEVAKRHLNLNVTYPHQDPEARDKFWQEAMEQESIFSKFENGWPLKYYVSDRWLAQKVSRAKNAPGRSSRGSRTTRAEVNVRDDDVQDTEQEELEYLDEGNPEDDAERERTASPTSATQDVEFQETSTLNSGGPSTGIRPFLPRKAKMQSLHRGTERDRDVFPDPPQSS